MEARDVPVIGRDLKQRDHSQTKNKPLACTQGSEQETPLERRKEEGRPSVRESYPWRTAEDPGGGGKMQGGAGKWSKQGQREVEGGGNQVPIDLSHSKHMLRLGTQIHTEAPKPLHWREQMTDLSRLTLPLGAPTSAPSLTGSGSKSHHS